jgi:uracil-DNA glycosylase
VSVDHRARLATVLERLRELGEDELYLDTLGSREALAMAAGAWRVAPGHPSSQLDVLATEAAGCQRCGLSAGRTQVVFGRGSAGAELVVVGEAPGAEEDRQGLPFVGPAGRLLDLLLLAVGFHRESVYICNVLKCRPPQNRDPRPEEVAACAPHLHAQLDALAPKAILAVGRFAGQMLTGSEASLGQLRGRLHEFRGVPVVATYHPAYLLRTPSATRTAWLDLQQLRQVFDEHP